ncbi:MAG: hypothetical protein ACP5HG_02220 [Anaerolineae bacterium]
MINILKYGLVITLLVVLIGGTVYILARPQEASADPVARGVRASEDAAAAPGQGWGRSGDRDAVERPAPRSADNGIRQGANAAQSGAAPDGATRGRGPNNADQMSRGLGDGPQAAAEAPAWETIEGIVLESDNELTVDTSSGSIVVGLGQQFYRDEMGFTVGEGDSVRVSGFYEDGEFKAGTVENLTTGDTITLRDETGRPMWAGRGNLANRP